MANTLGSVVIEMAVNLARLRSDFGQAAQISNTRLREIERNAARTVREISSVGRSVQAAFGTLGIGIGLASIVAGLKNAAAEAIRFGDEMSKAAAKTGVAGSVFSELAYAARQNDISLEALSKGFKTFQQRVSEAGSGTKSALATFRALGIEFDTFRQKSPEDQFEILAEQISRMKDPADRARAAVELFGRAGAELLPLFEQGAAGVRALREEAVKTGRALTDEQIQALADADLAIKNLTAAWESFARSLTASVAPTLIKILDTLREIGQVKLPDFGATFMREGPFASWSDLAKTVRERQFREEQAARAAANWSGLDPTLMRQGAAMVQGKAPPGFKEDDKTETDRRTAAERAGLFEIPILAQQITVGAVEQMYRDMDKATQTAIEGQVAKWSDLQAQLDELLAAQRITPEQYNARAEAITAQFLDLEPVKITAERIFPEAERSALSVFADEAARNLQSSFAQFLFDPMKEGFKGMLSGFVDTIRRMVAELASAQLLRAFFGWAAGAVGGGVGSFLGQMANAAATPGRATGGSVQAGSAYLVGERGPELLLMGRSGYVVPNDRLAGAGAGNVNVSYTIDARGADADRIMAMLPPLLKQTEQRTVAQVRDLIARGRLA